MTKKLDIKTVKTVGLMGVLNVILLPTTLFRGEMGLATSLAVNAVVLYGLHEIGRNNRPFSNALGSFAGFFSSSARDANTLSNITNGGATVTDLATEAVCGISPD